MVMTDPPPVQLPDWGPLYVEHRDRLWRVAAAQAYGLGYGLARQLAGEALSQVFLELITDPPRCTPQSWEAFLVARVKNRAIDLVRKEHAERRALFPESDSTPLSVSDQSDRVLDRLHADRLLASLDARSRHVVEQVVMFARPSKDVAAELGISPGRASQIKSEALKKLMTLSERQGEGQSC